MLGAALTTDGAFDRGRESFFAHAWADAHAQLMAADLQTPLEPDDLERLATAAYLLGRDDESAELWERAYRDLLRRNEEQRAAQAAFWLAFGLLNRGELARGSGWIARARRLLDDGRRDCREQGYLLLPVAIQSVEEGRPADALAIAGRAADIAERFGDRDLSTLARHIQGRALIRDGRIAEGLALLDEAMVAVTAGEVSPIVVGDVYCSVIEACQEIFDLRRAHEWTAALSRWCESQPDLVPYTGQCLVYRAEIMQLHGAWMDALDEAQRARERLSRAPGHPAVGTAVYRLAELHRLRGEFAEAEEAYREANRWGYPPQPGLALLRLAQGRVDAAAAAIRGALDEARDLMNRSRLLPAQVEIMLAARDVQAARDAADELSRLADNLDAPILRASATRAHGAVLLAEGDVRVALETLRRAWTAWQNLEAPYEAARVRLLVGLASRALGDEDTAEMEVDAARWVFQQLGALADVAVVDAMPRRPAADEGSALTPRELQVLRLVAAGKTNRSIAADLFLSEKTVARHVSNIFSKLGLSSRAAATAYAYEHHLV
jgi:ATP/maltotriose-dependent transcriptional regulator MalT